MTLEEAKEAIRRFPAQADQIIALYKSKLQEAGTGGMVAPVGMMRAGLNADGSYGAQAVSAPVQPAQTPDISIDKDKLAAVIAANNAAFAAGGAGNPKQKTWEDRWNEIKAAPQTAYDVLMTDKYKRR